MNIHFTDPRRRSWGFTLVELLLVISIISVLIALVVPSIGSMSGSRNLATGGSLLRDMVNMARQTARSHNSVTMLVGIIDGDTDANKTFALMERRENIWKQISKWERMPEGIALDPTESAIFVASADDTTTVARPTLKRHGADIPPGKYGFALFLPGGRLLSGSPEPPVLFLKQEKDGADPANAYKIIINPATGIPLVKRP